MDSSPEWEKRIQIWMDELPKYFYNPSGEAEVKGFTTFNHLSAKQAERGNFRFFPAGTLWGHKWEYGWFTADIILPDIVDGHRVVLKTDVGGESLVFINGKTAGASDKNHHFITLTEQAQTGAMYHILIESYSGHGPRLENGVPCPPGTITIAEPPKAQVQVGHTTFGIWNEMAYQLWMDVQTLWQVRCCEPMHSLRRQKIEKALRQFTLAVDFELPENERNNTFAAAREILAPVLACKNGSTAPEMYVCGQSHLDLAWLWTRAETWRKSARTISNQMALLNEYPEYRFLWCEPPLYIALKDYYPDLFEKVKEKIRSGQMAADGAMWVESDTNLPSGESLIRQILYGRRYYRKELGVNSEMVWLPDCFGFTASLPQIMTGCGVKYFATQKILRNYNGGDPFPYNIFWWEGNDGTRILSHIFKRNNAPIDPVSLIERWNVDRNQQENIDKFLYPFGYGDGGGGPTRDSVEFMCRVEDLEGVPRTKRAYPADFFHEIEKNSDEIENIYSGELYFQNHRGTYTSQARLKRGNRKAEFALREAEFWCTAAARCGYRYPAARLEENWKKTLFCQFHDVLPGTSITRVCEEAEADLASVIADSNHMMQMAAVSMSDGTKNTMTIWNSLNWNRRIIFELPNDWDGAEDENGNALPCRIFDGKKTACVDVLSCGTAVVHRGAGTAIKKQAKKPFVLENDYLRAEIDESGRLTQVWDREGRPWLKKAGNVFRMYKDIPVRYEAWDIDTVYEKQEVLLKETAQVEWIADDEIGQAIRVLRKIGNSDMEQIISLNRDSHRIEFDTKIDWQEHHKLLKVEFPTNVFAKYARHEIQYGYLERPTHRSRQYDKDRYEVCNHKWTAVAEDGRGAAILNDCKYGISTMDGTMALTLLRAPKVPDMYADLGEQTFKYAFTFWNSSFLKADVVRQGYELNVPVLITEGAAKLKLFKVSDPNIIVDTVKMAEDGKCMVIRMFQSKKTCTWCTLQLGFDALQCFRCNMIEEGHEPVPVVERSIALKFRPFEVITLIVK